MKKARSKLIVLLPGALLKACKEATGVSLPSQPATGKLYGVIYWHTRGDNVIANVGLMT